MYEIVFHGRGGQGSLLAARILANAYFFENKFVEAFPHFGAERRGAPVRAFLRVDAKPIRIKSPIFSADCAVILDDSLLEYVDISSGLKEDGLAIINTSLSPEQIELNRQYKTATCNATEIALRSIGKDIPNSAILGAFAFAAGLSVDSLIKGFRETFSETKTAEKNIEMAKIAVTATKMGVCSVEVGKEEEKAAAGFVGELKTGGIYRADGSSRQNITSSWTPFKAAIDQEKCNLCLFCYADCPEGCILRTEKGLKLDENYCKGCGICAEVCPLDAIKMKRKEE